MPFWATVCKMVRAMLWAVVCLSVCLSVLSCPVCMYVCPSVYLSCLSVCDVGVSWSNGRMHQDETWHGGRPRPRPHCVR